MARLAEIDKVLAEIASGVLDGSLDRANAAVAVMAHNARIRLTGVELSVKEQEIVQTGLAELQERWAEEMRSRGMDTPGHGQGPGGYRG